MGNIISQLPKLVIHTILQEFCLKEQLPLRLVCRDAQRYLEYDQRWLHWRNHLRNILWARSGLFHQPAGQGGMEEAMSERLWAKMVHIRDSRQRSIKRKSYHKRRYGTGHIYFQEELALTKSLGTDLEELYQISKKRRMNIVGCCGRPVIQIKQPQV